MYTPNNLLIIITISVFILTAETEHWAF